MWRDCVIVKEVRDSVLKLMNFVLILMDYVLKKMDFVLKMKEKVRKPDKERSSDSLDLSPAGESEATAAEGDCVKVHYCGFDVHNDEWIPRDSVRIRWTAQFGRVCDTCGQNENLDGAAFGEVTFTPNKTMNFVLKTMNFVLKMMNRSACRSTTSRLCGELRATRLRGA